MTLNQLKAEVAGLGFEKELEDDEALKICANRALRLIFTERPVRKMLNLSLYEPQILTRVPIICHRDGEEISVELLGRCFSFRAYGKGSYRIKDSDGTREGSFCGGGIYVKGFLKDSANISFFGDCFFTIHDLTSFDAKPSEDAEDIPAASNERSINLKKIADDFLAFDGLPKDENGREIKSASLCDGILRLPRSVNGEISLVYRRSPSPITSGDDKEIDIPAECEELLPLLTASFLWLDDDAEKAQYYMAIYKDAISNIKRFSNSGIDNSYRTNGWA